MMEWMADPTAWAGLLTLVILEIVLGIDNLIFIAILVDKLPPKHRDKARVIGLSLALLMRLGLLTIISWLVTLTTPWVELLGHVFSGRDVILIIGGLFLLFKGTIELHERLDPRTQHASGSRMYASFWVIVTQIVILDAVFSIDAVITAVGMVDQLPVMMIAVTIAIAIMIIASKPLTTFVNKHPTVVILCLGFLLMIGFSLLAEGFGFHVPKGYLYAAIVFSVLIEFFNQIAHRNQRKAEARRPMRERTAETVLRMLGKRPVSATEGGVHDLTPQDPAFVFGDEERNMVSGVLTLSERNVRSIMTPRNNVTWIDINDDPQTIQHKLETEPHSYLPVCRGSLDEVIGLGQAKEMLADLITDGQIKVKKLRESLIVPESIGILQLMDLFKEARGQLALVTDEFGAIEGVVTPIDIFEAIAGEFPDEDEQPDIVAVAEDQWLVDGAADLHHLEQVLDIDGLVNEDEEYSTLAGYLLERFGTLPQPKDQCLLEWGQHCYTFTVDALDGRRIGRVAICREPLETHPQEEEKNE